MVQGGLAGLRPAVVGFIASAGASLVLLALWGSDVISGMPDLVALGIFAAAFLCLRFLKKVPPIAVLLTCGALGGLIYSLI